MRPLPLIVGVFNFMEELVFRSEKGNPVTTSRLVARKFEKRHSDVIRAIMNMQCSDIFKQNNFALVKINNLDNPSPIIKGESEYIITEDGFTFLAMGFTGKEAAKFKEDYINEFRRMRNELVNNYQLPQTFAEALQLAADQAKQIEIMQPKAESFDTFIDSKSLQGFKEVANLLGMGRNKLMAELRALKILTSRNIPYQRFLDAGYFEVKESTQNGFNIPTTYTTPKGIDYIRKRITTH